MPPDLLDTSSNCDEGEHLVAAEAVHVAVLDLQLAALARLRLRLECVSSVLARVSWPVPLSAGEIWRSSTAYSSSTSGCMMHSASCAVVLVWVAIVGSMRLR